MRQLGWIRRAAAAAALVAIVAGGASVAQARLAAMDRPLSVDAVPHPRNGIQFGNNPVLRPMRTIDLVAGGFAPSTDIAVQIACRSKPVGTVSTDSQGIVRFSFTVPTDLADGPHVLSLSGPVAPSGRNTSTPAPSGPLVVTVPLVEYFRFSVSGSSSRVAGC